MALTPNELATMTRARALPPNEEVVKRAENAIDAKLPEVFDPAKDLCLVTLPVALLPPGIDEALMSLYCGKEKWRSMEIKHRVYDVAHMDIYFWR